MILDNKNTNLKVHEWIAKYTKEGKISLVTGHFTIGALAYLSEKLMRKLKSSISHRADFCVGYFNLLSWKEVADNVKNLGCGENNCC